MADEIVGFTGQTLVVIQTVLDEAYWDELELGLTALRHEIFHVVLEADDCVMRHRIEADEVEASARPWRLNHLSTYAVARRWLLARADLHLDTTALTPKEAADLIADAAGQRLGLVDEL